MDVRQHMKTLFGGQAIMNFFVGRFVHDERDVMLQQKKETEEASQKEKQSI